ncbi:hypothetical protein [Clostridium senegalense]|uniref:hypothetical protein n=1 Tax=Clostridium senegalense TaxID=1465809 RepID=UPI0002F9CF98|nr:hypothetical protein [Clostridium senegalense]
MKLPMQAKPVVRNLTQVSLKDKGIKPNQISTYEDCLINCNNLQSAIAREICKSLCR